MADKRDRAEASPAGYRSTIKLTPAIGDWTALRPVRMPTKKVKTGLYGFDRISQEELKVAQVIHYNFGQSLLAALKKNLSVGGDLFTISAEQSTYSEFLKKVYQPTVYCKISIPNLSDAVIVCVDMPVANTVINHALGGKDIAPITRKLTDIEEEVFTKVFQEEVPGYTAAFDKIFEAPTFQVINSPELQVEGTISPAGAFVFFQIELSLGDNPPGMINIGYTAASLKTLVERVDKRRSLRPVNFSKLPQSVLDGVTIPVIVNLGQTMVSTQDLHRLEVGDVVELDSSLGGFSPVLLGGHIKISGRPGTRGEKMAVRAFGAGVPKISAREMPETVEEPSAGGERRPGGENFSLEKKGEGEYPVPEEESIEEEIEEEKP